MKWIVMILALFLLGFLGGCAYERTASAMNAYAGSDTNRMAEVSVKAEDSTLNTKLAVDPGAVIPYGAEVVKRGIKAVKP